MDHEFLVLMAIALIGAAILIVAGGVGIILLLRQMSRLTAQVARQREEISVEYNVLLAWMGKITTGLQPLNTKCAAIDVLPACAMGLTEIGTMMNAQREALSLLANGVGDTMQTTSTLMRELEKKMSKTRFIELGDALPAMGVIDDASSVPPAAESIPLARKRKPVKKAAKKPAKKAAKRKPAKAKAKK